MNRAREEVLGGWLNDDSAQRPSVGSTYHGTGECKPCAWYWKPQGCRNGRDCLHCHLCPCDEIKVRKKTRHKVLAEKLKPFSQLQVAVLPGLCGRPPPGLGEAERRQDPISRPDMSAMSDDADLPAYVEVYPDVWNIFADSDSPERTTEGLGSPFDFSPDLGSVLYGRPESGMDWKELSGTSPNSDSMWGSDLGKMPDEKAPGPRCQMPEVMAAAFASRRSAEGSRDFSLGMI
eukprot:s4289_g3.t2